MKDEISIEIMLDNPNNSMRKREKIQSIDPPVDSPTATLSCFSDYDMHEEYDQNMEDESYLGFHVPQSDLFEETDALEFDQSTMIRMKQEIKNWKRERQELLKLRKVVTKQQQQQDELETKLKVYQRQQGHSQGGPEDPNGHYVHSLNIDEILRRNLNCFPEDEVAIQLEESQSMLEEIKKQVHDLQEELIEVRNDKERLKSEHFTIREIFQDQLNVAEDQLEAERRKREDVMNVHKLQLELQQMRAKEDEEEWDSQVQFWKQQFEEAQKQLQDEGGALQTEQGEHQLQVQGDRVDDDNDNVLTGEQVKKSKQDEGLPSQSLETVQEEQHGEEQGISVKREDTHDVSWEESTAQNAGAESMRQSDNASNEANEAIDKLEKELSESKSKYLESGARLTKLETVIHEMAISQQAMVQKIQSVVQLLQKTQQEKEKLKKEKITLLKRNKRETEKLKKGKLNLEIQGVGRLLQKTKQENEMLKKEKLTWLQKTKREHDKLKMEKQALEKQRKEKLTMMTRNAHR
ncbi:unnamed protein product [Cylindrotheca closterium]|uniref:Uncharacterized protein n=1 Tax=Cylindrotheca closterium TaxID=2856 RepID=A0AAD2G9G7_9STRA|nr:unnamed protein product [Cylindrotheca closterium]